MSITSITNIYVVRNSVASLVSLLWAWEWIWRKLCKVWSYITLVGSFQPT